MTTIMKETESNNSGQSHVTTTFPQEDSDDGDPEQLVEDGISSLRAYATLPLTNSDKVLVMQSWNKVLAYKSSFSEGLWLHWRLLMAQKKAEQDRDRKEQNDSYKLLETNQDPLALAMGARIADAEELIVGLLDGAIRAMCPHTQRVAREAYRPVQDDCHLDRSRTASLHLECETVSDYLKLFARCGVQPDAWALFVDACAWAWSTHVPYSQQDDKEDLDRGSQSAVLRCITQQVAIPAMQAWNDLKALAKEPLYEKVIPTFWAYFDKSDKATLGEKFYHFLFSKHTDLLDYFQTDMDSLAVHLIMAIDVIVHSPSHFGSANSCFRELMEHFGDVYLKMGVPAYSYPLVGLSLIACLKPDFDEYETITKDSEHPVKASEMETGFLRLYSEAMSMVYYPTVRREKLLQDVREFYGLMRDELNWSQGVFEKRIVEVECEISSTGTYVQTAEEIQVGARVAWRNSAKCIGRISWNTLEVRDRRHVTKPADVFAEVEDHLRGATAGTNIQSIMTVFRPLAPNETIGQRFFSSQYLRYAGYREEGSENVLGDPANVELTEYLIKNDLWTPPKTKSAFDILPLVLKVPGRATPYIHTLPRDCLFEVTIEHPTCPEFKSLGLRWCTIPAISNFKMTLGGVTYPNMPFNGWFVSTEIVRNLMERYGVGPRVAELFGIKSTDDPFWRQAVATEVDRAVLYSFKKKGFTIVDPHQVGESFCTHVRREREKFGRECPAQWSWIGGFTGPTNPTWHLEMRDFQVHPQYDYSVDMLALYESLETASTVTASTTSSAVSLPRVLILYGSETGKAEAVSRKLKQELRALKPTLLSLNEAAGLDIVKMKNITHLLCVTSTFGMGEAPSDAQEFFNVDIPELPGVSFTVLALGSSLYPHFCNAGISLDSKLAVAGLERLVCSVTKVDEALGSDGPIDAWLELVRHLILPHHLEKELELRRDEASRIKTSFSWHQAAENPSTTSIQDPLCIENTELTAKGCSRSVRKITFQVPEEQRYQTGDHLAVQPQNSASMLKRFLRCFRDELEQQAKKSTVVKEGTDLFDLQASQMFDLQSIESGITGPADVFFETPTSLRRLLTHVVDLSLAQSSARNLLTLCCDLLNEHPSSAAFWTGFLTFATPFTLGKGDIDALLSEFPTIVHFFERFSFLTRMPSPEQAPIVPLAEVLTVVQRLQPRFYSISSCCKSSPNEVSISVGVLNVVTSKKAKVEGVCSNYLAGLVANQDRANVMIRSSTFRLPSRLDGSPIVMVGAGTGLAPLIAFLEELALAHSQPHQVLGPVHLFYGLRCEADYLYRDLLDSYVAAGFLTLHVAYSGSPVYPKKYVQDLIKDMGPEYTDLLENPKTCYYVCGNAVMADGCREASIHVLREHGRQSRIAAVQKLRQMSAEGRWQSDVWGKVSHRDEARKTVEKSRRASARVWLNWNETAFHQNIIDVPVGA